MNDAIEILSIPVQNVSMREATDFVFSALKKEEPRLLLQPTRKC